MILGLVRKTWNEIWLMTAIIGAALLGVVTLLTRVVPRFLDQGGMDQFFERAPYAKPLIAALLGSGIGEEIRAEAMQALLWVHPTILTLLWTHAIVFCSRFPASEIDRGTIDVLLGLPVSRRKVFYSETLVWALTGVFLVLMSLWGYRLSASHMPEDMRPDSTKVAYILTNLYCMYFAVGSIAFLIASWCDRRGRAIAVTIALILVSFLLNFAAPFWESVEAISWMSVMTYYRPAQILQTGEFAYSDVITLLAIGATALIIGGEIVAHRSMCTT